MNIKRLKNKTQDHIKHIKTMFYAKLAVSLKKKRQKQNEDAIGIPFLYDDTIKQYKQYNLVDYGRNNRTNIFWKNCRKWLCRN